jgi:hypothetical protein
MNRSIVESIKMRLGGHGNGWLDELPNVLWAIRTTEKTSHRHTLYSLTYGSEAIIQAEIGIPTYRTKNVTEESNDKELMVNLTLLEERRNMASINEAR